MEERNLPLHRFRFNVETKEPLHMPAYNKGNVIRGGFGARTFNRQLRVEQENRVEKG